jgi:hypothetical protein
MHHLSWWHKVFCVFLLYRVFEFRQGRKSLWIANVLDSSTINRGGYDCRKAHLQEETLSGS